MVAEIHVDQLDDRRTQGAIVLDVRQPDEYAQGHVPGAALIPLGELADRTPEVPSGELYVICRSGGRSLKACEMLASQGIEAANVAGGTLAWIEAGKPVVEGSEPS